MAVSHTHPKISTSWVVTTSVLVETKEGGQHVHQMVMETVYIITPRATSSLKIMDCEVYHKLHNPLFWAFSAFIDVYAY